MDLLRRAATRVLVCVALLAGADRAIAQPAAFGRFTEDVELTGIAVKVDIYVPDADPPDGFAILAHGFGGSRGHHRELGAAFAREGFVAIVPDLPHFVDPTANARAIGELAARLAAGEFGLPPAEPGRLVLAGTSAGGLASLVAAASTRGVAGWIGLDPVDFTGDGVDAAVRLTVPGVVLVGDRSACNLFGSGRSIVRAAPGLLHLTPIGGASHCDFEDPTNNLCRVACGKESATTQARVRDEAIAAARAMVEAGGATAATKVSLTHEHVGHESGTP